MFLTLITFIAVLGILVLVHEVGHFVTARKSGVKVDEFGIGFPPRLFGLYKNTEGKWRTVGPYVKKTNSTIYSINWLPLGGFVKIKGEQGEFSEDEDSFGHKKIGTRIFIISAGVLMNIFLACALLSLGYSIGLPEVVDDSLSPSAAVRDEKIQIVEVLEGLPAHGVGIQIGDTISSVDGTKFTELEPLQNYLNTNIDQEVNIILTRGGDSVAEKITPQKLEETGKGGIGVGLVKTGLVSYPLNISILKGVETTFFLMKEIIFAFGSLLKNLVFGKGVTVDISGPVGIAVLTGQVARQGFVYILQFTALLSLNLAVINFLPFPALDGGRVVFLVIEKLRGRAVSAHIENFMHNLGFVFLILLVILVTFRDIMRFL